MMASVAIVLGIQFTYEKFVTRDLSCMSLVAISNFETRCFIDPGHCICLEIQNVGYMLWCHVFGILEIILKFIQY